MSRKIKSKMKIKIKSFALLAVWFMAAGLALAATVLIASQPAVIGWVKKAISYQ